MTRADSVEASIWVMAVLLLQNFDVSICILDNFEFLIAVLGSFTSGDPVLFGSVVILSDVGLALLTGWLTGDVRGP